MTSHRSAAHAVFVDTSAFYAIAATDDADHQRALTISRRLEADGAVLHTTNLVVAETHVLLKSRLVRRTTREHARAVARRFVEEIYRSSVVLERVTLEDD